MTQPWRTFFRRTDLDLSSESDKDFSLPQDTGRYARAGWWTIALGLGGFLLWAALAPLDRGVPATGVVMVEGQRKTVFHPNGGQVQHIGVRDGQWVKAGELLIRFDDTRAQADVESLQAQYDYARALLCRLQAERDEQDNILFPDEWQGQATTLTVQASQRQLFDSRRKTLRNALASYDELLSGYDYQLQGLQAIHHSRVEQQRALREQLDGMRQLSEGGYVPRNRLLEMERLYAQLNGSVAEDLARIGQLQSQKQEMSLRRMAHQQQFSQDVYSELVQVEVEVRAQEERLRAARYELANTRVLAPADGVVVGLAVFTEGGFVPAGSHLLDLVPSGQSFQVEARVPVHLVDALQPDQLVILSFSAFNSATTPQLEGVLETVSADRLTDEQTGIPYYRAQIRVTDSSLHKLGDRVIRPGMPVDVVIRTGERSLLSYLFKPLRDRSRQAMVDA
jgi:protease secretion system membrane fusion protein